jgi:hypothetical protein
MAMVEGRMYKEYKEYEEFAMTREKTEDIVKGHITFKFEEDKEEPVWTSLITRQAESDEGDDNNCSEEGAIKKSSSHLHNSGACRMPRWDGC